MTPTPDWVSETDVVKHFGISKSTFKNMRHKQIAACRTLCLCHWQRQGTSHLLHSAIRDMQKRLTVKLVKENAANRAAEFKRRREIIGTYDEVELILDS